MYPCIHSSLIYPLILDSCIPNPSIYPSIQPAVSVIYPFMYRSTHPSIYPWSISIPYLYVRLYLNPFMKWSLTEWYRRNRTRWWAVSGSPRSTCFGRAWPPCRVSFRTECPARNWSSCCHAPRCTWTKSCGRWPSSVFRTSSSISPAGGKTSSTVISHISFILYSIRYLSPHLHNLAISNIEFQNKLLKYFVMGGCRVYPVHRQRRSGHFTPAAG